MKKPKTTSNIEAFEEIFRQSPEFTAFYEEYKPADGVANRIISFLKASGQFEMAQLADIQIIKYDDDVHIMCFQDSFQVITLSGKEIPIPGDEIYDYHLEYMKKRAKVFRALSKAIGPLKGMMDKMVGDSKSGKRVVNGMPPEIKPLNEVKALENFNEGETYGNAT